MTPRRSLPILPVPIACLLAATLLAAGCTAGGKSSSRTLQHVTVAEFSKSPDGASHARTDAGGEEVRQSDATTPARPLAASSEDVAAAARSEPRRAAQQMRPGDAYIVDSLVGQINGRPIFADAFFEPIEDQLRQMRRTMTDREFQSEAGRVIGMHLWQLARDELFLTEAEAMLPPEQRQGLFAFMRYLREEEIAKGGGTLTGASRRVDEQHGMTLDQRVRDRLDQELVGHLIQQRIMPRVIVSWRDVQREYRRRADEFNPPPTLYLVRLRASIDDREQVEQIEAAIERGDAFGELVERYGQPGDGPWGPFTVGPDGYHDIPLSEVIREQLKGRQIGETTAGFRVGQTIVWLHLERVEQESRSLYDDDVQRSLIRQIQQRRMDAEERRYIESLFKKGINEELNQMGNRLLQIAMHRFGSAGT